MIGDSRKAPNQAAIRAMTFNVRGSFHRQDGVNVWPNRRDLNLMTIERCNLDMVAFQEVQAGNFEDYNNAKSIMGKEYDHVIGHACKRSMHWSSDEVKDRWHASKSLSGGFWTVYDYVVKNMGSSSQHDEYVPIYWKRARFACLDSGAFYLSETPTVESIGWESKLIRAATWVRLRELFTGCIVLVVNTHFPHEKHDPTRTECARVLLQELDQINKEDGAPIVLMGDFNCHGSLQTEAYALLLENGYQDTYCTDGTKFVNTFHHFLGVKCPWNLGRIDWILTRNFDGAQITHSHPACVIRDSKPPVYPSDHYPVIADLVLNTLK